MSLTLLSAADATKSTPVSEADKTKSTTTLDSRLVSFVKPRSFEADQYRMLRYAIERACPTESSRVIAVTSAVPGDGKTLTAVNLAGSIAKGGQSRVLLVDADLRRPAIAKVLPSGENARASTAKP